MNLDFVFSKSMNLNTIIKHSIKLRVFRLKSYIAKVAICNWFIPVCWSLHVANVP